MYRVQLTDAAYKSLTELLNRRLDYMKQNVSIFVEQIIVIEAILSEVNQAEHDVEPKPEAPKRIKKLPAVKNNLCPDHPLYAAKRAPRTGCEACWAAYGKYNGPEAVRVAKVKQNRSSKRRENIPTI